MTQDKHFAPFGNESAPYLWRIWDVLQLWRDDDHQWSSDEIEEVASVMMDWVGDERHTLPPEESRRHDPEDYEPTIDVGDALEPADPDGRPRTCTLTDEGAEALRRELEEEAFFAERMKADDDDLDHNYDPDFPGVALDEPYPADGDDDTYTSRIR